MLNIINWKHKNGITDNRIVRITENNYQMKLRIIDKQFCESRAVIQVMVIKNFQLLWML